MTATAALHKFSPPSTLGPADNFAPGSVEWAERISNQLQLGAMSVNRHTVHHLWDTIKAILTISPRPWDIWPEDHPYGTPDDYCIHITGHSWEFLFGVVVEFASDSIDAEFADNVGVNALSVRQMQTLLAQARVEHPGQGVRTDLLPYDVRKSSDHGGDGGNSANYLLRRLARQRPDLLSAYEQGRFKSVRAAAKAAGIIHELTVVERLLKLWLKASEKDRAEFLAKIDGKDIEDD
jgi:hypothetical protein